MAESTVTLTIADAAARLGISADTVRRKLKRGLLKGRRDNHGQWWIDLPEGGAEPTPQPTQRAAYAPMPDPTTLLVEELRNQISCLRKDIDAAHAREATEKERHAAEVARLEGVLHHLQRPWWRRLAG